MTYELIGTPRIEADYSDEYETTMVCDLRREDGVTGDVWIVAGVPDYQQGSSDAARTQDGYQRVRVFGDAHDMWCPATFLDAVEADANSEIKAILNACRAAALQIHNERMREEN